MPDVPECCEVLEVSKGNFAHQQDCYDYEEDLDADQLRKALKGVELGWWADQVLDIHPKRRILNMGKKQVNKKHVRLDSYFADLEEDHPHYQYKDSYIVDWILPGVTLVMARGFTLDPMTGDELSVYAVQEIRSNNERRVPLKPKPRRSGVYRD